MSTTNARPQRKRIGRWNEIAARHVVYQTPSGVEVDEVDHFEVNRRRVLFEDILLVTKHHYIGAAYVAINAVIALFLLIVGFAIGQTASVITFAVMAAPFAILAMVRLSVGVEVVTIFGKRSRARMRYAFRKRRARQVFAEITAKTREAQRRLADEIRASEPAEAAFADEPPMPPAAELPPQPPANG